MALRGKAAEPTKPTPGAKPDVIPRGPDVENPEGATAEAVAGESITVEINDEDFVIDLAMLDIDDVGEDMKRIASEIAYWGRVLALAEEQASVRDAAYRRWRGKSARALLADDPKLAEWKIKNEIEASQGFELHKLAVARATRDVSTLMKLVDALREKSHNVRSVGARQRDELNATGLTTRATPEEVERSREDEVRGAAEAVRESLSRPRAGSRRSRGRRAAESE